MTRFVAESIFGPERVRVGGDRNVGHTVESSGQILQIHNDLVGKHATGVSERYADADRLPVAGNAVYQAQINNAEVVTR